jgi:ubiquinone/menaquinone biosynthesis C-methylase UbiE
MSDFIKRFWENQASNHQTSHTASWGDNFAIDLEIENIGNYIKEGDTVLDMGCANGFASFRQLEVRNPAKIYGVDFAENMIKYANQVLDAYPQKNRLQFDVGDIRNINFEDEMFDVVYTTRVLINLSNWEEQIQSINECMRVTKKGGVVVFSEAFWEPLVLLNSIRALKQLPSLVEHDFNRYIKKEKLENYFRSKNISFECNDFSSLYYLGSRFLRELITDPSKYPGYSNPVNKEFYELEKEYSGGGFGIQQAYVVKKK